MGERNNLTPASAAARIKRERIKRGWSAKELAERARGFALEQGDEIKLSQQLISNYEQGDAKKLPHWLAYVWKAFGEADQETANDPHLHMGKTDNAVMIRLVPDHAGLGPGGTGEGDEGLVSFSRDLIENELRSSADHLLALVAEGNSMLPDFQGGDQILVDTKRKSLAQPGAFCLWDSDGHVVKFVEKVAGSEPTRIRLISANPLYEPVERLLEEVGIIGRVVWFGRRIR